MSNRRIRVAKPAALALTLGLSVLPGCNPDRVPEAAPRAGDAPQATAEPRYTREFIFVGERGGVPLVAPFTFSAVPREAEILRGARGWLAHGDTWDLFLDESWTSPTAGGVWRVLPTEDLRVIAGDAADVEALAFRRGERSLRLHLGQSLSSWNRGEQARYRISTGRMELGGELLRGAVVEGQRVRPAVEGELDVSGDFDWMFITNGEDLHFLLAEAMGGEQSPDRTFAWTLLPEGERVWNQSEVRWLEMLALEPARRDIPLRWSYRIPEAGVEGEVASLGYDVRLGPDRPGRRSVEVRHTVEGWVEIGELRHRVFGTVRHSQE